jgi:hypothetical protein
LKPDTAPAFAFQLPEGALSAPAFSKTFKLIACVVVLLAWAWAWQLWFLGILLPTWQSSGWIVAALGMMGYTLWHVLRGRTQLNAQAIEQSWVWTKRMDLSHMAYAKLVRVRGLEWLIAPRFYTRSFSGKMAVFYTADPALLAVLTRLESELRTARESAKPTARG